MRNVKSLSHDASDGYHVRARLWTLDLGAQIRKKRYEAHNREWCEVIEQEEQSVLKEGFGGGGPYMLDSPAGSERRGNQVSGRRWQGRSDGYGGFSGWSGDDGDLEDWGKGGVS